MSLDGGEFWVNDEYNTSHTHQWIFTISPFLTFYHDAMDVGNHGLNVRDDHIRVYCEFGLEVVLSSNGDT